ncbi:MAG: hypothetical protein GX592_05635 [Clostridiales bacterium]|mgnify:FL=1|nr:hypothetical protein [Clostridiales bacterium]
MREYAIARIEGAPDWEKIPALGIDNHLWLGESDIRAGAQICYGEDALFVRLRAWERHIRAEHTGRPHQIADDSCLEFFFCPAPGDTRYFNVEMNPNGALYLGFGSGRADLVRLLVADEQELFRPKPFRMDGGWGIEYRVPFEFIRRFLPEFRAEPGRAIRANCYKCGDKTARPHYIAWNPPASATPDFHRPEDFGRMVFA